MAKVFISYSRIDKDFAEKLANDLKKRGHKPWFDEWEIKVGDSKISKNEEGISEAEYAVLVLSSQLNEEPWIDNLWKSLYMGEIERNRIKILPILKSKCEVPVFLGTKKIADFTHDYDAGLEQLCSSMEYDAERVDKIKPIIWYLDDDSKWLNLFLGRHKDQFNIQIFNNRAEFLNKLDAIEFGSNDFPEIVLIDLYAPKSDFLVDRDLLEENNKRIQLLFKMENEIKTFVDDAWNPEGVEIVRIVRDYYSHEKLPIAVYTQRGLVLLEDELIEQLEKYKTHWLLKKQFYVDTESLILNKIILSGAENKHKQRHNILYIDDNPNFRKKFREKHKKHFDIKCIANLGEVLPTLENMRSHNLFPSLLLVDLYYPKGDDAEAKKKIELANSKLDEFHEFEAGLKKLIKKTHDPVGMQVIEAIRKIYDKKQLPILIYTQLGLLLLDDRRIRKIEELDAGWLLKDRYSIPTEQVKIIGQIIRSKK